MLDLLKLPYVVAQLVTSNGCCRVFDEVHVLSKQPCWQVIPALPRSCLHRMQICPGYPSSDGFRFC